MRRNWLDSVINFVSPAAGFRRDRLRMAQSILRKYEGGSAGRRTGGWTSAVSTSANAEIGPSLARLRDRSRDLVRNNSYAANAISVIEANVIGTGIQGQVQGLEGQALVRLTAAWKAWSGTTDCDADGQHDFYGLQSLAMRTIAESGEVLIVRRWNKPTGANKIPLQLQVLEGDYIDTSRTYDVSDGGWILQGVEFNKQGKRVAYWLWNQHPGENALSKNLTVQSRRVPAEDVLHVFRADRAGQVRGVPWGAPCLIRMRDFDEYEDAQLVRQKIAACFSAFVQDIEAPADAVAAQSAISDKLEPGAIEILPPGKTISFPNIPQVSDDGHAARTLRAIAAGYGVTYEAMTGDLTNVNFSSGRMGWLEFNRRVQKWQWLMFIPRFCTPSFSWFLQAAALAGYQTDGAWVTWTPPAREMIDPTKEIAAKKAEIRMGATSLSEVIREQGRVPEEVLNEIARDNVLLDKLGLKLDCDPRYIAAGGTAQQVTQEGAQNG